jgi:hypothetical protein
VERQLESACGWAPAERTLSPHNQSHCVTFHASDRPFAAAQGTRAFNFYQRFVTSFLFLSVIGESIAAELARAQGKKRGEYLTFFFENLIEFSTDPCCIFEFAAVNQFFF